MYPRLPFAQYEIGNPGKKSGGVIDTLHLAEVPYAVQALEGSPHMTPTLVKGLKNWFGEYLRWLKTHPRGIAERDMANNHSITWHVQAASFARFVGDEETLAYCREEYKNKLLPGQVAPGGGFTRELRRTKPYGYSLFVLDNLVILCHILSSCGGENLWEFALPDGRGARMCMEFIYPYVLDKSAWPYAKDVQHFDAWPAAMGCFLFAGIHLGEEKYIKLWQSLDPDPRDAEVRRNMTVRQALLWLPACGLS